MFKKGWKLTMKADMKNVKAGKLGYGCLMLFNKTECKLRLEDGGVLKKKKKKIIENFIQGDDEYDGFLLRGFGNLCGGKMKT